jgi:hypothetical protein
MTTNHILFSRHLEGAKKILQKVIDESAQIISVPNDKIKTYCYIKDWYYTEENDRFIGELPAVIQLKATSEQLEEYVSMEKDVIIVVDDIESFHDNNYWLYESHVRQAMGEFMQKLYDYMEKKKIVAQNNTPSFDEIK